MNALILTDQVEAGLILEDFQRVDHLTGQAKRRQELLEHASWLTSPN